MKKILQVTSVYGKTSVFGAKCIRHAGGYHARAWEARGKIVATTRIYQRSETCWKNLKMKLARKYGEA